MSYTQEYLEIKGKLLSYPQTSLHACQNQVYMCPPCTIRQPVMLIVSNAATVQLLHVLPALKYYQQTCGHGPKGLQQNGRTRPGQ